MSHSLTESLLHTGAVTVPDDGDDLNGASVEVGFQALANRTALAHAQLTGAMPCTGSPLLCQAGVTVDGSLTAHNNVFVDGTLYSNGGLVANAAATFNNSVAFNNTANFNGAINHTGSLNGTIGNFSSVSAIDIAVSNELVGKVRRKLRRLRITADADQTIMAAAYDHISCGNVLTTLRAWNLTTTGLTDGDSIEFYNGSNFNVLLKVGGSTIFTLVAGNYQQKIRLIWDGSAFYAG